MPIYEYKCEQCEKTHEKIRKISEQDEPIACPDCEQPMERTISTTGSPIFKGRGWHATDYR